MKRNKTGTNKKKEKKNKEDSEWLQHVFLKPGEFINCDCLRHRASNNKQARPTSPSRGKAQITPTIERQRQGLLHKGKNCVSPLRGLANTW